MAQNKATGSKFGGLDVRRIISATTYIQLLLDTIKIYFSLKKNLPFRDPSVSGRGSMQSVLNRPQTGRSSSVLQPSTIIKQEIFYFSESQLLILDSVCVWNSSCTTALLSATADHVGYIEKKKS